MYTTPLHYIHKRKAVMTNFAGYELPLYYTSIIEEHLAVRERAGVFDVSHMGRILLEGENALSLLEKILPVAVTLKQDSKAFYSFMLNDEGFIIDDLIILRLSGQKFILVVNAANRKKDLDHIHKHSENYSVKIEDITEKTCMFAVQGPDSIGIISNEVPEIQVPQNRYGLSISRIGENEVIVSRTGYTGEDGVEIIIPCKDNIELAELTWNRISKQAKECGLGARDTLRIEAGLPLYGNEIDENTTPFELDLGRLIAWDKDFIGKYKLSQHMEVKRKISGLVLEKDIPRAGFDVMNEHNLSIGIVTSGTYSPILKRGIALAKIDKDYAAAGSTVFVRVRNINRSSTVVKPPFYDTSKYGYRRANS
jgi:aminomethyltransferase